MQDIKVSLAEICEVRGSGLDAAELLSIVSIAVDSLPSCPKNTVFDAENVFITSNAKVHIRPVSSSTVDEVFVPPEWQKGEYDDGAAAIYCLGAVLRACGAEEAADVDLFSLVNIMTVTMISTRPTANRLAQMARNQLKGRDARVIITSLYVEIMGDEESNQLPDGMELDDLSDEEMDGVSNSVGIVKRAVDFFDEDEEKSSRGPSTSTSSGNSSGNSTQKDNSIFGDDDIHHHEVPSVEEMDESLPSINYKPPSPYSNDKFNTTYIEETSLGETSYHEETETKTTRSNHFDDDFVAPSTTAVQHASAVVRNPFSDSDDEIEEYANHGGTLSGRDPFDYKPTANGFHKVEETKVHVEKEVIHKVAEPMEEIKMETEVKTTINKEYSREAASFSQHRFSSSSDEIEEIDVYDGRFEQNNSQSQPVKQTYFSDLRYDSPPSFDDQEMVMEKKNGGFDKKESNSSPVVQPKESSRRRSSIAELDRLKEETDRLRAEAGRIEAERKELEERVKEEEKREKIIQKESHVDAIVIQELPPALRNIRHSVEDETPIDAAFEDAMREKRRDSGALMADPVVVGPVEKDSPRLERRNSLAPSRISGRQSKRGKRKTKAIPEFFDHTRYPSIRLKAPTAKKKRLTLLRVEQTNVWVELLNGQKVEVSCRTDAVARDIFFLIVQHMNVNEHFFFGLSFVRGMITDMSMSASYRTPVSIRGLLTSLDGEHFFLEEHQRLEKFAPSGWKSHKGTSQYVLHLRFKFYPQILEFVKTEVTMHELYLQIRRDVIEERMQPKRDAAFQLAAIALQAEFGNRPPAAVLEYFELQHYLPARFCLNDDPKRLRAMLAAMHSQYNNMKTQEAENKYIQICQHHADFGVHLHRVYRSKPALHSSSAAPFDPDAGIALFIGILPKGINVYEEQGNLREKLAEHEWPSTQTLQFDKKKFVIVAIRDGHQVETVFYTDHHTKSSYFVKFAASQHRFMMKMRSWKTTLKHENTIQRMPDVAVEGREIQQNIKDGVSPLEEASSLFEKIPTRRPQLMETSRLSYDSQPSPSPRRTPIQQEIDRNDSQLERFEESSSLGGDKPSDSMLFSVTLIKDPSAGLGLTLVDGNLNGVKGVYVKSVAENGAGMRAGLCVGDRLLAVNGTSLSGGDRHKAVDLVKACTSNVQMDISRLDGVVRHEPSASRDSDIIAQQRSSLDALTIPNAKGVSRTPPAPRKFTNKRQRAVSDFGAIGDTLPVLDSDNVINIKAISGLHLDESDEERGEYHLPAASLYHFDHHDDDELKTPTSPNSDVQSVEPKKKHRYARKSNMDFPEEVSEMDEFDSSDDVIYVSLQRNPVGSLGVQIASVGGRVCVKQLTSEPALSNPLIQVGMQLVYVNGEEVTGRSHQEVVSLLRNGGDTVELGLKHQEEMTLTVTLDKSIHGSLGLSLAKRTGTQGIFIRTIADNSAASAEGSLRVGDRLLALDDKSVEGLSPTAILERLKVVVGPIRITVERQ